jgi:cohesin complex subunit SCC1
MLQHTDAVPAMKIPKLMELPSLVLVDRLFVNGTGEIYYSSPLLKLSMTSVQPLRNSPSSRASPPPPSSSASPPERARYQDPVGFAFEEFQNVVDPQSREKQRAIFEEPKLHFVNQANNATDNNITVTPGNSGTDARSIPSSGSGHGHVSNTSDTNSGRLKRKQYSSPRIGSGGLEPVIEERSWQDFELAPENDLIVETGPTQTQKRPIVDQQIDQITDSIRT